MNAKQLKNALLQHAIQGRLVPQDPGDEPADVLLQRIRAEKEQLIKEGKIKKQKPLPPITEEEKPFAIPDSWQWVRLGEIVTINPRNSLSDDLEVSFIPMNLIKDGYENSHTSEIRIWKTVKSGFTHFAENDIAIAKITPCFQNRKSAILSNLKNGFGAGTTELHIVRIFTKLLIHKYFLYIFKTEMFISQGMKFFTGTAGQQRIGKDFISLFPIPLPPLAEQQSIVSRLEELLPDVEAYGTAQEQLTALESSFPQQLRKSLLQEAIQGRLVPQNPDDEPADVLLQRIHAEKEQLIKEGKIKKQKPLPPITEEEKPFAIPDSWQWVRLGEIIHICSASRVHQSDWKSSGIPFYRAREIAKLADQGYVNNDLFISKILFDKLKLGGVPEHNDIMITAVGTLGKSYVVKLNDIFYYKDASVICLKNLYKINPHYIKYTFESNYIKNQIKKKSSGTTVGTITIINANNYILPLPPLAEQQRIVARLEELLPLCDGLLSAGGQA